MTLTIPQPFGGLVIPRSRGVPFSLEFVEGSHLTDTNSRQVFTFNNVPFGNPDPNRMLIVAHACQRSGGQGTQTGTIGGESATILRQTGSNVHASIMYAKVPTGTSGTVVVSYNASGFRDCSIGVFRLVGQVSDTPYDSDTASGGGTLNATVDVASNGGVVASIAGVDGNTNWTNATEVFDILLPTTITHSAALYVGGPETNRTISAGPTVRAICALSWA